MAIKRTKNLASSRDQYGAYYGDFRGVDFSNDHTLVNANRFAYSVNMYKDYQSKNGVAIETIPGFRRRFSVDGGGRINGIHKSTRYGSVYVHVGTKLYHWNNYPNTAGVVLDASVKLGTPGFSSGLNIWEIDVTDVAEGNGGGVADGCRIVGVYYRDRRDNQEYYVRPTTPSAEYTLSVSIAALQEGDYVNVQYVESEAYAMNEKDANNIAIGEVVLADKKSVSFEIGSELYIKDGKSFLRVLSPERQNHAVTNVIDGLNSIPWDIDTYLGSSYIPTRYTGIVLVGENATGGIELEPRNIFSKYFKIFYNDRKSMSYPLKEKVNPEGTILVEVNGTLIPKGSSEDGQYWTYQPDNSITLSIPPDSYGALPPEGEPVVRILAEYDAASVEKYRGYIENTTVCEVVGERVFLVSSSNERLVRYSRRIIDTIDGSFYFTETDWVTVGIESSTKITGFLPVGDSVMVLSNSPKADQIPICFLTPASTGEELIPTVYTTEYGLFARGCLGACANFIDDPVFVSLGGVEAMGTLSVRLERAMEHRSTLVDAKLTNTDLSKAFMHEWNGYLLVFVEGKVFMADSRQAYLDSMGIKQYEWYYLEGIGVYDGQQLDADGVMVGGTFKPATCAFSDGNDLYFGTESGVICKFNFDKRDEYGEITPKWYTFDGRTIVCGCATKMDNCGIPHLTKSTVKKSMVIKTKSMLKSDIKIKVRTNKDLYKQVARISNAIFSFEDMEFEDFSFVTQESSLFSVHEKEKKWVEKQIYLYSDTHKRPFALYYIAFRYFVAGKFKQT